MMRMRVEGYLVLSCALLVVVIAAGVFTGGKTPTELRPLNTSTIPNSKNVVLGFSSGLANDFGQALGDRWIIAEESNITLENKTNQDSVNFISMNFGLGLCQTTRTLTISYLGTEFRRTISRDQSIEAISLRILLPKKSFLLVSLRINGVGCTILNDPRVFFGSLTNWTFVSRLGL